MFPYKGLEEEEPETAEIPSLGINGYKTLSANPAPIPIEETQPIELNQEDETIRSWRLWGQRAEESNIADTEENYNPMYRTILN